MTGIEQMHLSVRIVSLKGLGAGWKEKRIVLAPHGKERRPSSAEVFLEFRIKRYIALIVAKQIELNLVVSWPGEERGIERPGIWRQPFRRRYPMLVLPLRRFRLEESAQRRAVLRRRLFPVGLDRIPALAEPLEISVAVL